MGDRQTFNAVSSDGSMNEKKDALHEGRDEGFMDIDRMVNEGLGGGNVTMNNGWIDDSTTDTMRKDREKEGEEQR